jgi:hypothetical protein
MNLFSQKNSITQQIKLNKFWHEKFRKSLVLDISLSVLKSMIMYIQDAKSSKQANNTLVKMYKLIKRNSNKNCHYIKTWHIRFLK